MSGTAGSAIIDRVHQEAFPTHWSISEGSIEKHISVDSLGGGSLRADITSFDNFVVCQLTFTTNEPMSCTCQGRGESIALYFNLVGSCLLTDGSREHVITAGEHTIYFSSDYCEKPQLVPENGEVRILEINVPVSYYANLFSGYSALQDNFLSRITKNQESQLQSDMLPITLPMRWIINTIEQNRRTGAMKRIFFKAKILELLLMQVEQMEVHERHLNGLADKPSERDALYEAKAILEKSLANPPTIKNLAKMVGINEFSLKKGFKEIFNDTIYGFVSNAKMQQARQILLEGNKSIQEVASLAGYKNPQHFTAAFKKHYGVLPSKVTNSQ